jgi:hypothetical protein
MTSFGIYRRDNGAMFNNELASILQADREREIQRELRNRRLLTPADEVAIERAPRAVQSTQFSDPLQAAQCRGSALRSTPRA